MGRHAESPDVQKHAAGALAILALDDENQRKIGAQVANAHEYICALPEENVAIGNRKHTHTHTHSHTQGGIEALVTAMGRHAESPDVQKNAAKALRNLAYTHPENKRKIGAQVANAHEYICALPEENVAIGNRKHTHSLSCTHTQGGIEALVTAMGRHAESPDVQEEAAWALFTLTDDDENRGKIGAQVANAHEYICALPEENVAIGNRKRTHTHTHKLTQGGIEALVTAMGRHAESPSVQDFAVWALGNLADRSDLRQRIKRAGAGEAVRRAMAPLAPRQTPRRAGRRCWTR
jgi:hypothetical protein